MRLVRPLVAAFAVGAVLLTSGCGSGGDALKGKSADDIVSQAKQTLSSAKSVHLAGTMTDEDGDVTVDLTVTSGGDAQGSIKIEGATIEIIAVSDVMYMKADADSWQKISDDAATGQLLAGKWLKVPADAASSEDFADFSQLVSLTEIAKQFTPTAAKRQSGTTKINGNEAVAVEGQDGDGDDIVLYVANEKDAKPLRVQPGKDASGKGHLDFTDWDKSVDIKAPSDAVDLGSIMGSEGGA